MARNYPRFLFSNPSNTKTPGPFIVHLLYPKFVATFKTKDYWLITFLDEDFAYESMMSAIEDAKQWFRKSYIEESYIFPFRNVL